jgi:DNA-binding XRE family transcriptional regulator
VAPTRSTRSRPATSVRERGPIADARQSAGLSQRELADRIGVPLWTVDRLETGTEDPSPHIDAIAAATGLAPNLLSRVEPEAEVAAPGKQDSPGDMPGPVGDAGTSSLWVRNLILGAIVLLVTIRFFAEDLHVLPRGVKLVDVPILLGLLVLYWIAPRTRIPSAMSVRYLVLALGFLAVCVASVLVNSQRTEPGPTFLFIYGFIAPILVFHVVRTLWPAGHSLAASKVLVGLAWIELLVVGAINLPEYLKDHNPDVVSGTFGENAYQLVFFLLVCIALVAGLTTIERKRRTARLAPLFFAGTAATILLAQYRSILLTAVLAVLFVTVLLGLVRVRGALAGVLVAITFIAALSAIPSMFPELKIQDAVNSVTGQPGVYIKARVDAGSDIPKIYTDQPSAVVLGAGPGTVSSRAWSTYYKASNRDSLGVSLPFLLSGHQTDYAQKYTIPHQDDTGAIEGSFIIANPFASYYALLEEVGILGFLLMVFIYGRALLDCARISLTSLRHASDGDALPGLALAATIGFFVIIQMAILENWWEVTRLTFLLWMIFAIVTKEFEARYGDVTPERVLMRSDQVIVK